MQVTETLNSGLKREIKVTVPASDMEERLMKRLVDVKDKVRINGFRPGKVPVQHLRKVYGKSFMAEVVNEILTNSTRSIITERGEKAAMQPEVKMTEDEKEAEKILNGGADFEFELAYEVIPAIEIKDLSGIKVTRKVYDVPETEIDDAGEEGRRIRALLRAEGRQGREWRPRHHRLRRQDRRRGFPGRAGQRPAAGAGLQGIHPRLRGPAGRRQGRRREAGHRDLPGGLQRRPSGRQGSDLRRHRQGSVEARRAGDQRRDGQEPRPRIRWSACARS